jgi:hypothetical protein
MTKTDNIDLEKRMASGVDKFTIKSFEIDNTSSELLKRWNQHDIYLEKELNSYTQTNGAKTTAEKIAN